MNYRHAFHAGNFADCHKHALLVLLLRALARKPAGFFLLDTHAGAGRTDLSDAPAIRTGEFRRGIGRLLEDPPAPLRDYVGLVQELGLYPGSPLIARAVLRPTDRLACCELHPEEHAALRRRFAGDRQVGVHHRDAWEAVGALLPPPERRGLTLIDPPYEQPDEFNRLLGALSTALRRFPTGIIAAWYPIKHRASVRAFHTAVRELLARTAVTAELCLREPLDPGRLNGSGLLVLNPPFRFEQEAAAVQAALLDRLGDREPGEAVNLTPLVSEKMPA